MLNHKTCLRSRGNTQAQAGTGEEPPRELKGCWVSRPDTDPHLNHPPPHTGWKRLTDGDSATSVNPVFRRTRTISCLVACTAIVYTLLIRRITGLPGPSRAGGGRIGGTPTRWRL